MQKLEEVKDKKTKCLKCCCLCTGMIVILLYFKLL